MSRETPFARLRSPAGSTADMGPTGTQTGHQEPHVETAGTESCLCFPLWPSRDPSNEFKLIADALDGESGSGWLYKRRKTVKSSWVKRYFVIKDGFLYMFRDDTRFQFKQCVCLVNARCQAAGTEGNKYMFELSHPQYPTQQFASPRRAEAGMWVNGINGHIGQARENGAKDGFLLLRATQAPQTWMNKWCLLHNGELRVFDSPKDPSPILTISLLDVEIYRTVTDKGLFAFNIFEKDNEKGKRVKHEFAVEEHSSREPWVTRLFQQMKTLREKVLGKEKKKQDEEDEEEEELCSVLQQSSSSSLSLDPPRTCHSAPPAAGPDRLNLSQCSRGVSKRISLQRPPEPMEGFLLKQTQGHKVFQRRFFEVGLPGELRYYKHMKTEANKPRGVVALWELNGPEAITVTDGRDVQIHANNRSYHLRCAGAEEAQRWSTRLQEWVVFAKQNPPSEPTSAESRPSLIHTQSLRRLASLFVREDSGTQYAKANNEFDGNSNNEETVSKKRGGLKEQLSRHLSRMFTRGESLGVSTSVNNNQYTREESCTPSTHRSSYDRQESLRSPTTA